MRGLVSLAGMSFSDPREPEDTFPWIWSTPTLADPEFVPRVHFVLLLHLPRGTCYRLPNICLLLPVWAEGA